MTSINFGLHPSSEGCLLPIEIVAKVICYNFLCAARHFEHAFSDNPQVFLEGEWISVPSVSIEGKVWHFIVGCIELIPIVGHIVALAEKIFEMNPLPVKTPMTIPINPHFVHVPITPLLSTHDPFLPRPIPSLPPAELISDEFDENEICLNRAMVSCGSKHDQLVEIHSLLSDIVSPLQYFGFSHDQIIGLFSADTRALWAKLEGHANSILQEDEYLEFIKELQVSVEKDILLSRIPFEKWQAVIFHSMINSNSTIIVRSSSNEDDKVLNAGGNDTINGVSNEEEFKTALAKVVSSYFSLKSFKNRSEFENPFLRMPICSVLIMEQITENQNEKLPIVSGVMMTNELKWSAPEEDGIIHIAASWGFANGTNNKIACDEWAITNDQSYSTIRQKPYRNVSSNLGKTEKVANAKSLRDKPCLSTDQLAQLEKVAERFNKPMNVEFVVKGTNLYIVQARPIDEQNLDGDFNYLDPAKGLSASNVFKGTMILSGRNQVIPLEKREIVFAKDLERAEMLFQKDYAKAVVVYTDESSTTHPACNFAKYRPPIPCLVLPYDQWLLAKNMDNHEKYSLCTQSGTLAQSHSELSVCQGLFTHPARFALSVAIETKSIQGVSKHPSIIALQDLLATTPELLQDRLGKIEGLLQQIFAELFHKIAVKTASLSIVYQSLQNLSANILQSMKNASDKMQMAQLAFHASMLRQLISQSKNQICGSHSLSGLEVATSLPFFIEDFMKKHIDHPVLCELALFGLNGFDEAIQQKWLNFLEENHQSNLLDTLNTLLTIQNHLGLAPHWLADNFFKPPQSLELLINKTEEENTIHSQFVTLRKEIAEISEDLNTCESKEELEQIWNKLELASNSFLEICSKNKCKHSLIMDLIDLWDLSTKAVQTLQLFDETEEKLYFKKRVDAFTEFALNSSRCNILNYSLEDLIVNYLKLRRTVTDSVGKGSRPFSVQHWIIPISHGQIAPITTDDEHLTVLHQNVLQAATHANQNHLPTKLAEAYNYFINIRNDAKNFTKSTGNYFSIDNKQASVRINIPINYHSTVIILTQKKGCEEIEVTVYMRGSDRERSQHLGFFELFGAMNKIPLIDSLIFQTDLKVVFTVRDSEKLQLLALAVQYVNFSTLGEQKTHHQLLKSIFNEFIQENNRGLLRKIINEKTNDKIAELLWDLIMESHRIPLIAKAADVIDCIYEFLKKNNRLHELIQKECPFPIALLVDAINERIEYEVLDFKVEGEFFFYFVLNAKEIQEIWLEELKKHSVEIVGFIKSDNFISDLNENQTNNLNTILKACSLLEYSAGENSI